MGHCLCKCKTTTAEHGESSGSRSRTANTDVGIDEYRPTSYSSQQNRVERASVGVDVRDLILETLTVIRTLVN
uniref:Uncharacterized protein n=1 Tax=Plectus sambesii TaxID=2011161 RepID=A0A914VFR3_9BILA